jgi:nucleotide-binding universal stress UspA family protein
VKVLLANDSSKHSQAASDYLLSLPFRRPIDLDIVSAVTPPMMIESGTMGMPADLGIFISEECESARTRVQRTAEQLGGPVHSVHTHVPIGPPATELLNIAEQSGTDLIVLGAVGHSALERVLLGSVSDYVATHADTSTLVVRPPIRQSSTSPELNKIVIALSGRPEDQRMIEWLRCFKFRPNVEVHLVRVVQVQSFYSQDIKQKASEFWKTYLDEAQSQVLDFESTLQAMGLNTETHLVESAHIGEAIIDYAEQHGIDLIMTGDSDSGLLTRVFLGSTSRYVLRHSRCSVVIVRDKEDRLKAKQQAAEKSRQAMADAN